MKIRYYITSITMFVLLIISHIKFALIQPSNIVVGAIIFAGINTAVMVILNKMLVRRKFSSEIANLKQKGNLKDVSYELFLLSSEDHNNEEFYEQILKKAIDTLPKATKGSIIKIEEDHTLRFVTLIGYDYEALKDVHLKLEDTFIYSQTSGLLDKPVIINNPIERNKENMNKADSEIIGAELDEIQSILSAPLYVNDNIWGMINIDSPYQYAYTDDDLQLLELYTINVENAIRLHALMEKNDYLIKYDTLTNIYNREYYSRVLRKLGRKNDQPFCYISIDLDNFKRINDTYGHLAGDEYLKVFAKGIDEQLNKGEIFARIGGDEFVIIGVDYRFSYLLKIMDRIKNSFAENPIIIEGIEEYISFSYGYAEFPEEGNTVEKVVELADKRMYENKRINELKR